MARITLEEQSGIKRILGVPLYEIETFDTRDPDMLRAFLWLAFHRNDPNATVARIDITMKEIEALERAGAEVTVDMEEDGTEVEPDPPSPSASDASGNANALPDEPQNGSDGSHTGSETPQPASGSPPSSTPSPT